jgi:ribosomal protein S18 acetylase RimI-like enzyme
MPTKTVRVIEARPPHLDAILRVERSAFENAWSRDELGNCLSSINVRGFIAVVDRRVAGFAIMRFGRRTCRIVNLAVDPKYCRRRVATELLERMRRLALRDQLESIICDVDEYALPMQLLLRTQKFRCTKSNNAFYRFRLAL